VAKQNVTSAPQEHIPWISGGVSDEARDEMRNSAAAYNVHLIYRFLKLPLLSSALLSAGEMYFDFRFYVLDFHKNQPCIRYYGRNKFALSGFC